MVRLPPMLEDNEKTLDKCIHELTALFRGELHQLNAPFRGDSHELHASFGEELYELN